MSAKTKAPSPVVSFVQSVWDNANSGKGHSWQILNGALQSALKLAIHCHFRFELDDFATVMKRFDGGYWFGADSDGKGYGTGWYSYAIENNNMSACQSFEAWKAMAPFLFLGKRLGAGSELCIWEDWKELAPGTLTRFATDDQMLERLNREGVTKWWVTGFDCQTIRLASYYDKGANPGGHRQGKPKKLRKIERVELESMSKAFRAAMRPLKVKKGKESA